MSAAALAMGTGYGDRVRRWALSRRGLRVSIAWGLYRADETLACMRREAETRRAWGAWVCSADDAMRYDDDALARLRDGCAQTLRDVADAVCAGEWPEWPWGENALAVLGDCPQDWTDHEPIVAAVRCALANGDRTGLVGLGWECRDGVAVR